MHEQVVAAQQANGDPKTWKRPSIIKYVRSILKKCHFWPTRSGGRLVSLDHLLCMSVRGRPTKIPFGWTHKPCSDYLKFSVKLGTVTGLILIALIKWKNRWWPLWTSLLHNYTIPDFYRSDPQRMSGLHWPTMYVCPGRSNLRTISRPGHPLWTLPYPTQTRDLRIPSPPLYGRKAARSHKCMAAYTALHSTADQ